MITIETIEVIYMFLMIIMVCKQIKKNRQIKHKAKGFVI